MLLIVRLSLMLLASASLTLTHAARAVRHSPLRLRARRRPRVTQIVYIKTHATGSSTLTNIFHRFCATYDLSCYVPTYYAGKMADRATLRDVWHRKRDHNLSWDVWPNHAVLEPDLFEKIIPNNTKVSIFRNPLDRVVSSWAHFAKDIKRTVEMLRNNQVPEELCGPEGKRMSNQVPMDVFKQLDFVILTEHMNLGLVMMKRQFGWKLRDIVYASLKNTHEADTWKAQLRALLTGPRDRMTHATKKMLEHCVFGNETPIYRMAADRFFNDWRALGQLGQVEVQREMVVFEDLLKRVGKCCDEKPEDEYCAELAEDNVEWAGEAKHKHRKHLGCRQLLPRT